jgi:Tol biopolymer transport system component
MRWVLSAHWSLDGTKVAFVARDTLYMVGADGRGLRRVTSTEGAEVFPSGIFTWAPDGKRLAYLAGEAALAESGRSGPTGAGRSS